MKKILTFGLAWWLAGAVVAEDMTLTAASDPFPPFIDPGSPTQGLSMEVLRAAMATQGYQIELQIMPWARAESGVRTGKVDFLPDTWMTEARKAYLIYSDPYASNEIKFIKRKGDPFEYSGLPSLKGKTVGVVNGYGYGNDFLQAQSFTREVGNDLVENVKKLLGRRFDLTLEDPFVATSLLKASAPELLKEIEFSKVALSTNPLYITSGLGNPRGRLLVEAFNRGLVLITASGRLKQILKNYGVK